MIVAKPVTIQNKCGLHARPSASFATMASKFKSHIEVEKDGERVNGKSIIGLMTLAAGRGSVLKITADGPDAEQAVAALEELVEANFYEQEES